MACGFEALSDEPVLAAVAARAIAYMEIITISIFAHKHLAGRQYTRRINDAIIEILEAAAVTGSVPKLAVANALKEVNEDWTDRIDAFVEENAGVSARLYAAAAKHPLSIHYSVVGYGAMANALTKHLDMLRCCCRVTGFRT